VSEVNHIGNLFARLDSFEWWKITTLVRKTTSGKPIRGYCVEIRDRRPGEEYRKVSSASSAVLATAIERCIAKATGRASQSGRVKLARPTTPPSLKLACVDEDPSGGGSQNKQETD